MLYKQNNGTVNSTLPKLSASKAKKVLGCGNKDGEIFMTADPAMGEKRLLVYNSKKDILKQVKVIGRKDGCKSEIRITCV